MDGMIALTALLLAAAPHAHAAALDTSRIELLTGAKGKLDRVADVFKVSVPRTDLAPSVGGVKLDNDRILAVARTTIALRKVLGPPRGASHALCRDLWATGSRQDDRRL